jgi:hypothetical protein
MDGFHGSAVPDGEMRALLDSDILLLLLLL